MMSGGQGGQRRIRGLVIKNEPRHFPVTVSKLQRYKVKDTNMDFRATDFFMAYHNDYGFTCEVHSAVTAAQFVGSFRLTNLNQST